MRENDIKRNESVLGKIDNSTMKEKKLMKQDERSELGNEGDKLQPMYIGGAAANRAER